MKLYVTELTAIDPTDGIFKKFAGPYIKAPSAKDAWKWCQNNGYGYLTVKGELIEEIDDAGLAEKIQREQKIKNLN